LQAAYAAAAAAAANRKEHKQFREFEKAFHGCLVAVFSVVKSIKINVIKSSLNDKCVSVQILEDIEWKWEWEWQWQWE